MSVPGYMQMSRGYKPVRIKIRKTTGFEEVQAAAHPDYPIFAYRDEGFRRPEFGITHVPSGFRMAIFPSESAATSAIELLTQKAEAQGLTWDVSAEELQSNPAYGAIFKEVHAKLKPKRKAKPRPPKGVRGDDVLIKRMREEGLTDLAGGKKYQYWAYPAAEGGTGIYIRMAKKTARLVERFRKTGYGARLGPLEDRGISSEIYYGDIARDPGIADRLVESYIKQAVLGRMRG